MKTLSEYYTDAASFADMAAASAEYGALFQAQRDRAVVPADLLARNADPSESEIRHAIEGNICRCTGYHNIVIAIREAARVMRDGSAAAVTA